MKTLLNRYNRVVEHGKKYQFNYSDVCLIQARFTVKITWRKDLEKKIDFCMKASPPTQFFFVTEKPYNCWKK